MHRNHFSTERIDYRRFWQSLCWPYKKDTQKQRRDLTVTAHNMGFDPADVDWLSDCGYGEEEIEAALNDSDAFRALLSDVILLRCAYERRKNPCSGVTAD